MKHERAADREIFGNSFSIIVAIAYYLGEANDESELTHAYAKALGYKNLDEFVGASAYLFGQQPASLQERAAHEARIHRARCELLAKYAGGA